MLEVVLSGLVTGWAIAIPIGAVGALLVAVTARTRLLVGSAAGVVFVAAAFVASASSWQLALAALGTALGRSVTSDRGRLVTGLVSAVAIAALALRTLAT